MGTDVSNPETQTYKHMGTNQTHKHKPTTMFIINLPRNTNTKTQTHNTKPQLNAYIDRCISLQNFSPPKKKKKNPRNKKSTKPLNERKHEIEKGKIEYPLEEIHSIGERERPKTDLQFVGLFAWV